jgi:hypothetical protein
MSRTDWTLWRACQVCNAAIGQPCMQLLSVYADGRRMRGELDAPHRSRKPRTPRKDTR